MANNFLAPSDCTAPTLARLARLLLEIPLAFSMPSAAKPALSASTLTRTRTHIDLHRVSCNTSRHVPKRSQFVIREYTFLLGHLSSSKNTFVRGNGIIYEFAFGWV